MKRIVWAIEWNNPDPEYWFRKDDSFQDAMVQLAEKYAVHAVVLHPSRTDTAIIHGVTYHFCRTREQLVDRLVKLRPDLVNFWGFGQQSSRMIDERLPGIPKTVYPVGAQSKAAPVHDLPFVDRVFATTAEQRQKIWDDTRYPRRQVVVCPFTATKTFTAKTHYGGERYDVIYVSDWRPVKRQHLLVDALVATEFDRLAFLGNLDDRAYFDRNAQKLHDSVMKSVEIIHRVPARIVASYYQESKVAVQLSESEGGSRVVTEALASGLPLIVCRDCATNAQQVVHGETGFIVEPKPDAIARQLNTLLADPALCEKIGKAAAHKSWSRPATDTMGGIFAREFARLLQ